MTEHATATTARRRPDRRFAGGLPWEPAPGHGGFASSAPIVLPDNAKPKRRPTPEDLEELGRRTAGVAHDFNNLLSVIMVCAGEIAESAEGVQRERAEEIREAARRGADLSRGLLIEEREAGGPAPPAEPPPLCIDDAIRGSLTLIGRALGPDIRLSFASGVALPRAGIAATDLERVLLNLAANSRDALPAGGTVAIRTELVPIPPGDGSLGTGLHVRITFSDDGTGMPPETARRALEPYYSTKDGSAGSGLGLAGAHAMIREAGGDLRINSRPGAGTTISIYLPALDGAGEPLALARIGR